MFGLVTPCRHTLPGPLHEAWTAHLCGLCLGLRDRHGQLARVTTNVDAVTISVLVAAQRPEHAATRRAGACVLRGLRSATVVRSDAPAARLAGGVSMVLAAGLLNDHVADHDLPATLRPAAVRLGRRWESRGRAALAGVGLDASVLAGTAARQACAERQVHAERLLDPARQPLLTVTSPTEDAVGAALAHTAALAGRPGNVAPLTDAGRMIGRVAHLTDAVVDQRDDDRRGRWNPLTATGTDPGVAVAAIGTALGRLGVALGCLDLPGRGPGASAAEALQAELAHRLLDDALPRSVRRLLARAGYPARACGPGHARAHRGDLSVVAAEPPWPGPYPPEPGAPGLPAPGQVPGPPFPPGPASPPGPAVGPDGPAAYPPAYFPGQHPGPIEPLTGQPESPGARGCCSWSRCFECCADGCCESCSDGCDCSC